MALLDALVYDVNYSGSGDHLMLPAETGKRIRVWRFILTFHAEDSDTVGVMTFKNGSTTMAGNFFYHDRTSIVLGAEQRNWILGDVGASLSMNLSENVHVRGSFVAEYVV